MLMTGVKRWVKPASSTVAVNGLILSYREWPGQQGPLICLPSLTGHKGSFDSLAQRLATDYHLYALDLRGRGDSDKPGDGYGFAYHALDLLGFADALNLDSFGIVGHSFGATVGVYLASIRPERVRAAVLLDGGADPTDRLLQAMRSLVRDQARLYPSREAYLTAMRETPYFQPWGEALERYFAEDAVCLPDGQVTSKASAQAIERDLDLHASYSMCLHFPALRCPTLFIRPRQGLLGSRGHVFSDREAAAIVRWIPQGRRVDVEGVNHYTMLLHDDPPIVAPIRTFLSEVLVETVQLDLRLSS
jgi:pimeloyl-ACP methyl ester carboxylesterase